MIKSISDFFEPFMILVVFGGLALFVLFVLSMNITPDNVQQSDINQYRVYYAECYQMTEEVEMCRSLAAEYAARK